MSEVITLRIPEALKKEMATLNINWSEFLREAIREKILVTRKEMAFKKMDAIREQYEGTDYVMSKEVKKWRKLH